MSKEAVVHCENSDLVSMGVGSTETIEAGAGLTRQSVFVPCVGIGNRSDTIAGNVYHTCKAKVIKTAQHSDLSFAINSPGSNIKYQFKQDGCHAVVLCLRLHQNMRLISSLGSVREKNSLAICLYCTLCSFFFLFTWG